MSPAKPPKKLSRLAVIKEYFGLSASSAMKEMKALTDEDKDELAQGAARNMGLTKDQVNFEL